MGRGAKKPKRAKKGFSVFTTATLPLTDKDYEGIFRPRALKRIIR